MSAAGSAGEWRGRDMIDRDGARIGRVEEVYGRAGAENPEWALVRTGLLGGSKLVPLEGAALEPEAVRVPHEKRFVKGGPSVQAAVDLSPQDEERVYRYYGMAVDAGGAGAPTTTTPAPPTGSEPGYAAEEPVVPAAPAPEQTAGAAPAAAGEGATAPDADRPASGATEPAPTERRPPATGPHSTGIRPGGEMDEFGRLRPPEEGTLGGR
ncbi:MAG: PRC-barrel domain-containing protein [Actinomycetota bacterium]|nr:PRC-barrel domain-containing protein [Actinomycetota bacterium]